jgi:multiple sugar transport system ATP-binding protein
MRREISRLHHELRATMLYVTHDQAEAMTLGDRIVVLHGGHVQQIDAPLALYRSPRNTFVASFIGSPAMNLMEGMLVQDGELVFRARGDAFSLRLPGSRQRALAARAGRPVVLGIRPEDVHAGAIAPATGVRMRLDLVEPLGQELLVSARAGDHEVTARLAPAPADAPGTPLAPGQEISFAFDTAALHFFDPETRERIS